MEEAEAFLASLGDGGAVMLKALAGGGGRGMRPVTSRAELPEAFERCASEAKAAFGDGGLYAEQFFPRARHVEVQVVGDGTGAVVHLWDRECSLQRQRQKLVEIAPAIGVADVVRAALLVAAVKMAYSAGYKSLGTIEFLVNGTDGEPHFAFIEANPRLQVEHTVTEEVTGLDLVRIQLEIAGGATLASLGLGKQGSVPAAYGVAVQTRVNLETMTPDGQARPTGGVLSAYEPPSGAGIRVDGFGYSGYKTSVRYDCAVGESGRACRTRCRPPLRSRTARSAGSACAARRATSRSYRALTARCRRWRERDPHPLRGKSTSANSSQRRPQRR